MTDELVALCALVVVVLCVAGLYASAYRENWMQHVGMALLTVGAAMVGWHAWTYGRASQRLAVLMAGLALYALGTARKVRQHRERPHCDDDAPGHGADG